MLQNYIRVKPNIGIFDAGAFRCFLQPELTHFQPRSVTYPRSKDRTFDFCGVVYCNQSIIKGHTTC
jgi:hypothetical protein